MILNAFLIAVRRFKKQKLFSIINILGLGIGISAALVIYLMVQFDFSFDTWRKDSDRIYRVVSDITFAGNAEFKNSGVPYPLPEATKKEIPGIEAGTHLVTTYDIKVQLPSAGNNHPEYKDQKNIIYADDQYFSVFDYKWLAGSAQNALHNIGEVVLTKSRAELYFGTTDPSRMIGKTIVYNDTMTAKVTGIVEDPKQNTDLKFQEFISLITRKEGDMKEQFNTGWESINSDSQFFIKLDKNAKSTTIESQLAILRNKHRENQKEKDATVNHLQPLSDVHFNANYDALEQRQAHKPTMIGLLAVAAFLLLLGCINFINLTTAQSALRAKEIGIRKTAGSSKKQLIFQFLSETFVLTVIATILSIAIVPWLLKIFQDFIAPEISFSSLNHFHVWVFLAVLVVIVSFLSGFYPAMVLTRFQPITVLKGQMGNSKTSKAWLRKSLTIVQFVIAQFLVIATLLVNKQVHYSLNKDLGYKKDAIVSFSVPWNLNAYENDKAIVLLQDLNKMAGIKTVSLAGSSPASRNTQSTELKFAVKNVPVPTMVELKFADKNYFDVYQMKLVAGRNLQPSDTTKEYVINETYARSLGFQDPKDVVGQMLEGGGSNPGIQFFPVVGVIKDFNSKGTQVAITPLAFTTRKMQSRTYHIALSNSDQGSNGWKRVIDEMGVSFKKIFPDALYEPKFYDKSIEEFYKKEQDTSKLLSWAAGLCIFISCLGLLGLVIYITNTRTKEIGIRKVLGASVTQVVALLSKDFIFLICIAFIITLPLAWMVLHNWLEDFAYRTSLSWWIFAATGIGMLLLALMILGLRTIRSAITNPVKALRSE